MTASKLIMVEVAYALPHVQKILELQVAEGTTAFEAAEQSGITDEFPDIDIETARMGVFGQAFGTRGLESAREYVLQPHDRVEIYRPLVIDPKEVRKRRAEEAKAKRS